MKIVHGLLCLIIDALCILINLKDLIFKTKLKDKIEASICLVIFSVLFISVAVIYFI